MLYAFKVYYAKNYAGIIRQLRPSEGLMLTMSGGLTYIPAAEKLEGRLSANLGGTLHTFAWNLFSRLCGVPALVLQPQHTVWAQV